MEKKTLFTVGNMILFLIEVSLDLSNQSFGVFLMVTVDYIFPNFHFFSFSISFNSFFLPELLFSLYPLMA
jgi:hypothetical protein